MKKQMANTSVAPGRDLSQLPSSLESILASFEYELDRYTNNTYSYHAVANKLVKQEVEESNPPYTVPNDGMINNLSNLVCTLSRLNDNNERIINLLQSYV